MRSALPHPFGVPQSPPRQYRQQVLGRAAPHRFIRPHYRLSATASAGLCGVQGGSAGWAGACGLQFRCGGSCGGGGEDGAADASQQGVPVVMVVVPRGTLAHPARLHKAAPMYEHPARAALSARAAQVAARDGRSHARCVQGSSNYHLRYFSGICRVLALPAVFARPCRRRMSRVAYMYNPGRLQGSIAD